MAFHKDFSFIREGDIIAYNGTHGSRVESLPPKQGISLHFPALLGKIAVSATALDLLHPRRIRVIGPHLDPHGIEEDGLGGTIEEFNSIAAVIELFPPGQHIPVKKFELTSGFSQTETFEFEHVIVAPAPAGQWEIRITNKDTKAGTVELGVVSVIDRQPLRREFLAHRLLDHAYLVILEALQPVVRLSGDTLTIAFSEEVRGFFGTSADDSHNPLATQKIKLPSGIVSIEGEGRLTSFEMRARSGRTLREAVFDRFQSDKNAFETALQKITPGTPNATVLIQTLQDKLDANNLFRQEWEGRTLPDDAVIHVSSAFSDISVIATADVGLFDVDAQGVLHKLTVDIFIAFNRKLGSCDVLALSPPVDIELTDFEAKLLDDLGIIPDLNQLIEEKLPGPIEKAGPQIARFLGEALSHLASRHSVLHSLTSNGNNWLVDYTAIPGESIPVSGGSSVHTGTNGPIGGVGGTDSGTVKPATGGGSGPTLDLSLGVLPPQEQFAVVKPETLARLDQIETLVFVMMENRSFDHLLGYLRQVRGPQYEGLSGSEANLVLGRTQPVFMRYAGEIVPKPITQIPISPSHDFDPVKDQIAGGKMSGFAQDFENRHPGFAELVMTFYTGEELKVYDRLAADFNVCDHWYAAHAGPTFPNRFVTLTGTTPELKNFEVDDPILGFLTGRTIFDLLDQHNIEWAVFESDLSIIRMFNKFRLNANRIRPYVNRDDPSQSFAAVAARGELPPVVFVEPNFVDIPPIATATDDHPPANLRRGQNFIAEVVNALTASPQWKRTMLAITYDEHGGFYDHVAPPGTALGPPEFIDKIPRVHPGGRDFMGPRVPSFVVSPWVSAGSVCKDILDHTSIIKTILLRHRAQLSTHEFTQFGPRTNMIAHLGVVLDLDQPREVLPHPMERMGIRPDAPDPTAVAPLLANLSTLIGPPEHDDFHESLRRAPLPKRK